MKPFPNDFLSAPHYSFTLGLDVVLSSPWRKEILQECEDKSKILCFIKLIWPKAYSTHSDTIHKPSFQTPGSSSNVTKNHRRYSMDTYKTVDMNSLDLKRFNHNDFYMCHYFNNNRLQFAVAVYVYLQCRQLFCYALKTTEFYGARCVYFEIETIFICICYIKFLFHKMFQSQVVSCNPLGRIPAFDSMSRVFEFCGGHWQRSSLKVSYLTYLTSALNKD
jgi:hypothetical protein